MQGIECLEVLSDSEQVLFLKNLTNLGRHKISKYLLKDYVYLRHFISGAFIWSDTNEGSDYWNAIAEKVKNKL